MVVLISISLMMSDDEPLFICMLALCMSSFGKYLFRAFAHFEIQLSSFFGIELFDIYIFFYIFWILTSGSDLQIFSQTS